MTDALELLRANLAGDPRSIMSRAHAEQIIAEIERLRAELAEVEKRATLADEVNAQIRDDLSRAERMVHTLSDKAATLNVDLVAARAELAAERLQNEPWRKMREQYYALIEELQSIGEEFGVKGGENRTVGLRRVLTKMRADFAAERGRAESEMERADANYEDLTRAVDRVAKLREALVMARPWLKTLLGVGDDEGGEIKESLAAIDAVLRETKESGDE